MIVLEIIVEFILRDILLGLIGGILMRANNGVLKLRGVQPRSIEEIKLDKIKKRYEFNAVKLISKDQNLKRGAKGVVVEIVDLDYCFVEFKEAEDEVRKIKYRDLLIIR